MKYALYYHIDDSENAYLDGTYGLKRAIKRMQELLRWYPSVTLMGVRHYAPKERR